MASYIVDNFYVVRRHNYNIVNWSMPTPATGAAAFNIVSYNVYRTTKTNGYDYEQIAVITSLDANNQIDTVFVDIGVEDSTVYFYKINIVDGGPNYDNTDVYSSEETGIYFADIQDNNPESVETAAARWDVNDWDSSYWG